ncbi:MULTISPECIES: replication initiator [Kitasatospora]|uniref:Putative replication initiation protein n=1 Tax=Kitasatospora setae (strain ATCC 33774 / DSM 43861 / JCM 3304 / KCC A-0304 / NBRC 14216 / KM-6054) TaxID=452652 RepID=E4NEY4_KITSK|nr:MULTISPECIES: replication initiator [Kitasatospora]BAJ29920.1 putative replication initiation protein [Kitasatospora setae KM-6054]
MTEPDPRTVPSLFTRDLITLAQRDDFDRIEHAVQRLAGCTQPVQLTGRTTTLDATTHEVLRHYTTDTEPLGRLLVACGNRRASRCPACSRTYAADTYHLIRAGLSGGKGTPEQVRTHPRVFATLTAPTFGPVHNRPTTRTGKPFPCRCGTLHGADHPTLGTPLEPTAYDYTGAVLFNAHAGALWARFTTYLRRAVAHAAGLTTTELREHCRVSFAKVAEFQKRGLVHFHAIVRLDGPDGGTTAPPSWATPDLLTGAVRQAAERAVVTVTSDAIGERQLRWGAQIDVREIARPDRTADPAEPLTDAAVAGYIAKYATKSAEGTGTIDRPLYCATCKGRGRTPTVPGLTAECRTCDGTGLADPLADLKVAAHVRQMIRTCWHLGALPDFAGLNLTKWAHMLGFRGHFSTKSRRYSTTLGTLRGARRTWQAEQARIRDGRPVLDPATTLVLSDWRYLATGYTPGEELLAQTVRDNRAATRRLKREGDSK